MNERIYINRTDPAPISLEVETLSDGSKVYNLELRTASIPFRDENRSREAMAMIAAALNHAASINVLHI